MATENKRKPLSKIAAEYLKQLPNLPNLEIAAIILRDIPILKRESVVTSLGRLRKCPYAAKVKVDVNEKVNDESSYEERGDTATWSFPKTSQITCLQDLIDVCKIDLAQWEIERHIINKWEVGAKDAANELQIKPLYQVKAWLRKKQPILVDEVLKGVLEEIKKYTPPSPAYAYKPESETAAIINLYDAHIDKVCLVDETGHNSTIEQNVANFESLFDKLLAPCATHNPELIIIPVGHDFFNTNGSSNTTKKGTPQDVFIKSEDSFKIGVRALRKVIDKAAMVARVHVLIIKANHSEDKDFYLGQVLSAVYELNPNVTIEDSRLQRKYYQYGINLWGFAHGDKEKGKVAQLPLMMAEEKKQAWANTTFRRFYLGDIHHKEEFQFRRVKDFPACEVKFLRSVGTSDKWHCDNGYIGIPKTAEADVWHKEKGLIAQFSSHI